ncbi:putative protein phosphatase-5 [Monocercomonoides exilis]|uniref:putative protein phosphatase-5 n=1 Tax=Monocercomonoides exilis TaxID=2049356 RepID=UPI003559F677|nr:putative protein phosphatase-5 [Monocercomonoides exilis]|eukprot:MONOS_194.1-p1 / transcript=MONOS_194.1 / gene=MONOS_194 / organism=Monocercomonoides_exilis_PA203 / gene_product=protein phosphatase-5 / transcript_product=protein phosphatase-5 / location=Mono_scaffold00003:207664-211541(+) / protein_length=1132 / sequence_SO=supercontig / SO=protein_coding / is_pseudo=false
MFESVGYPSEDRIFVFNGDYVDRGSLSMEVIVLLFLLKIRFPSSVTLLRGNHESDVMNSVCGFRTECSTKYSRFVYFLFRDAFNQLPVGALISDDPQDEAIFGGEDEIEVMKMQKDDTPIQRPVDFVNVVQEKKKERKSKQSSKEKEKEKKEKEKEKEENKNEEENVAAQYEYGFGSRAGTFFEGCGVCGNSFGVLSDDAQSLSSISSSENEDDDESGSDEEEAKEKEAKEKETIRKEEEEEKEEKEEEYIGDEYEMKAIELEYEMKRKKCEEFISRLKQPKDPNSTRVLVIHGGLPSNDNVILANIELLNRRQQPSDDEDLFSDLLWTDPHNGKERVKSIRGFRTDFGSDATELFVRQNQLSYFIRSHQMVMDGIEITHKQKCVTVFSAPCYCDVNANKGAVLQLYPSRAMADKDEGEKKSAEEVNENEKDASEKELVEEEKNEEKAKEEIKLDDKSECENTKAEEVPTLESEVNTQSNHNEIENTEMNHNTSFITDEEIEIIRKQSMNFLLEDEENERFAKEEELIDRHYKIKRRFASFRKRRYLEINSEISNEKSNESSNEEKKEDYFKLESENDKREEKKEVEAKAEKEKEKEKQNENSDNEHETADGSDICSSNSEEKEEYKFSRKSPELSKFEQFRAMEDRQVNVEDLSGTEEDDPNEPTEAELRQRRSAVEKRKKDLSIERRKKRYMQFSKRTTSSGTKNRWNPNEAVMQMHRGVKIGTAGASGKKYYVRGGDGHKKRLYVVKKDDDEQPSETKVTEDSEKKEECTETEMNEKTESKKNDERDICNEVVCEKVCDVKHKKSKLKKDDSNVLEHAIASATTKESEMPLLLKRPSTTHNVTHHQKMEPSPQTDKLASNASETAGVEESQDLSSQKESKMRPVTATVAVKDSHAALSRRRVVTASRNRISSSEAVLPYEYHNDHLEKEIVSKKENQKEQENNGEKKKSTLKSFMNRVSNFFSFSNSKQHSSSSSSSTRLEHSPDYPVDTKSEDLTLKLQSSILSDSQMQSHKDAKDPKAKQSLSRSLSASGKLSASSALSSSSASSSTSSSSSPSSSTTTSSTHPLNSPAHPIISRFETSIPCLFAVTFTSTPHKGFESMKYASPAQRRDVERKRQEARRRSARAAKA